MAGALILSVTYGINVLPKDDPYIAIAEEALRALSLTGNAGAYLGTPGRATLHVWGTEPFVPVDNLPFCKPVSGTVRSATLIHRRLLVKYVPSWFPGAKFKQEAAEWRTPTIALNEAPFAYVKQSMV